MTAEARIRPLRPSDHARVIAVIDPENVASLRVAEKLGMRYVRDVMLEGWTHPDRVYAIDRHEFHPA